MNIFFAAVGIAVDSKPKGCSTVKSWNRDPQLFLLVLPEKNSHTPHILLLSRTSGKY